MKLGWQELFMEYGFRPVTGERGFFERRSNGIGVQLCFMTESANKNRRELIGYVTLQDEILPGNSVVSSVYFDERGIHKESHMSKSYVEGDLEKLDGIFSQFVEPWSNYYLNPFNVAGLIISKYTSRGEFEYMDTRYPEGPRITQLPPNANRYMGVVESSLGHTQKAKEYFETYLEFLARKASRAKGEFKQEYEQEVVLLEDRIARLGQLH